METRQITDTVFALGKLKTKPAGKHFEYILGDTLKQLNQPERIQDLDHMQIAYLLKGLIKLRADFTDQIHKFEVELRQSILERLNADHELTSSFEPYSISKVLRYFLACN